MGTRPYQQLKDLELVCNSNNVVIEIGSENGEGSSVWLHNWAKQRNLDFYSVDVEHRIRERQHPEINWVVASSGSDWCKNFLPALNKKIKVLYLDNFDWFTGLTEDIPLYVQKNIDSYRQRGIEPSNENSQKEHRLQVEYCLPYLDSQSVVIMDDTFYNKQTNCWDGKCGTAIPLLLEHGFKMHGNEYASRGIG